MTPNRHLGTTLIRLTPVAALAILLGAVTVAVVGPAGMAWVDEPVARFVIAHRTAAWTTAMKIITTIGNGPVLASIALAGALALTTLTRKWWDLALVAITVGGASAFNNLAKHVFDLPRPPIRDAVAVADGYGFPSGHAASATATFGVLAWLYAANVPSRPARIACWAVGSLLALAIGFSRVYLGVHWTSDVLGGWLFGALWLTVVLVAWSLLPVTVRRSVPGSSGRR